jgi:hypothetical protein
VNDGYSFFIRDKKGEIIGHGVVYFATSSRDYAIRKFVMQSAEARVTDPVAVPLSPVIATVRH